MNTKPKSKKAAPPDDVEVYFNRQDGSYWMKVAGVPTMLGKNELKREFYSLGFNKEDWFPAHNGNLPCFEWLLWNAMHNRAVDYAGPISGKRTGIYEYNGQRILVTSEAAGVFDEIPKRLPDPVLFPAFIQELLPVDRDGAEQWVFYCYWMAVALKTLRAGENRPGQFVWLAGEANCGKSLLQYMTTDILGGRQGNPIRYLQDKTTFNADLAGAEHWLIEELKSTPDFRTRGALGDALKEGLNNRLFSIHPKNKQAYTIPLFRRGTGSINDDAEILQQLPPMGSSNDDKTMLFHCKAAKNFFNRYKHVEGTPSLIKETADDGEVDEVRLWADFQKEVPAIRSWLLRQFKNIPASMSDGRFIIRAYHNPELREELTTFTPEARLLALMDEALWSEVTPGEPLLAVKGRAMEIEERLRSHPRFKFAAEKLLSKSWQMGSYLGKIFKSKPERVSKSVRDGYTAWTINPPPSTKAPTNAET